MDNDARADLMFDLAALLERYEDDHDPEAVHEAAIGYIKGRQPEPPQSSKD